jgi:hypothetical protein
LHRAAPNLFSASASSLVPLLHFDRAPGGEHRFDVREGHVESDDDRSDAIAIYFAASESELRE